MRLIALTIALFAVLVSLNLHGSSLAQGAIVWDAEHAADHYVAAPILARLDPLTARKRKPQLLATPRAIRADEYAHTTPWAFAQVTHEPPFPVVNTNMGNGQNMLMVPTMPVRHLTAVIRPVTWGYLLFGVQKGLAWSWWFPSFSCFIALVLLFDRIVVGQRWLSVFGAAWYCWSPYVVCWSLWPAYYTGLGAFATVSAYWLLRARRPRNVVFAGIGLGLSFPAFAIMLYPPWQVPLGLTFLAVFIGLVVRDKLLRALVTDRLRLLTFGGAVVLSLAFLASFYFACADAIYALSHSAYPGTRRLFGGDTPAARLFGGLYNRYTIYYQLLPYQNQSELAGFFLGFPAVMVAAAISARVRKGLGIIGWLLLGLAAFFTVFCVTTIPEWLATITLMSRVQGFRAQIAIGLVSIILCLLLINAMRKQSPWNKTSLLTAGAVFVACSALFLWLGWEFQQLSHLFKLDEGYPYQLILIPVLASATLAVMTLGLARLTAAVFLLDAVLSSWAFNPLSSGFTPYQTTELGRAIAKVVASDPRDAEGRQGLWLSYGWPTYPDTATIAQMMGARALAGVHHQPQLDLWRPLDPTGAQIVSYNRYAQVFLIPRPLGHPKVEFVLPFYLKLNLHASPVHPDLLKLGARYVLTFGAVPHIQDPPMKLLYRGVKGDFAIWRLPDPKPEVPSAGP